MRGISIFSLLLSVIISAACDDDNDPQQTPTTSPDIRFTDPANSGGCVDFQFYHYSDDREYGLLLAGNADSLGLTTDWQSFALDEDGVRLLTLELYEFSQPVSNYFCDDVVEAKEDPIQEWMAKEGTVRLRITQPPNEVGVYAIDVLLLDISIGSLRLDRIERDNVEVGWIPG